MVRGFYFLRWVEKKVPLVNFGNFCPDLKKILIYMIIFFEVVFWAFLSFEESQCGRKMFSAHQNWFWKTWGVYGWDTKNFFYVHTCGTFLCPQRKIVRFWANFEFSVNAYVCLLCASHSTHIWDTYSSGVVEHSTIMVYE